ncbi:MAG: hypothetical protein K2M78_09995 [Lachnospiraceae bacterium]|nr:hypothetical protein [Lachnospiraceae bacterium]
MYFSSLEELKKIISICDGVWNKDYLYEYLVWDSNIEFKEYINSFFQDYLDNEKLADLLFSFLLDDYYDGSDCQMGAARLISRMDKHLLQTKKELLIKAQNNEVDWKRPFSDEEYLDWLL